MSQENVSGMLFALVVIGLAAYLEIRDHADCIAAVVATFGRSIVTFLSLVEDLVSAGGNGAVGAADVRLAVRGGRVP